jgi:hypothetical protein
MSVAHSPGVPENVEDYMKKREEDITAEEKADAQRRIAGGTGK